MSKVTKAVLTGGGHATRLRPITNTINKHLIPLAGQPMIFHAIDKVVKAGIKEIFINTNPSEIQLQEVVGDGSKWGIKIHYFEQQGGPQGIAHVVKQAERFIGHDPFMFFLSDNIVLSDLSEFIDEFYKQNYDCMLAFSKVKDPERFGVPYFDDHGNLVKVLEKPENPPNNFAVTGIYLYGPDLFFKAFDHIEKSNRGEYEISDIHSYLLNTGQKVGYKEITGWWKDTGKPEDLLVANALLMDHLPDNFWQKDNVFIGQGAEIKNNVKINGPVIIGQGCILSDCIINKHSTIGAGSVIKKAEVFNSLIFENCHIDCFIKIEDSIIGKNSKIIKKEGGDLCGLILGDNSLM
ncbi:MAG: glucose-1-phosphate thymidylyltransferase [bacterium]